MLKRLLCLSLLITGSISAMVFDNRFLPLYEKPFRRITGHPSHFRLQPFFMQADRGFSETERLHIPDFDGTYDSVSINNALIKRGFPDSLRSDFRTRSTLPWFRKGRIEAQGLAVLYEQDILCGSLGNCVPYWTLSVGGNALFAHVSSRHEFLLQSSELQLFPGDQEYLFAVKEKMNGLLGVTPALFSHTGLGDIDLYIRLGGRWDYILKTKRIEAAIRSGILFPTASETPLNNPAAIPIGAEKHWGSYIQLENEVEVKEDMTFGWMFRAQKRFERTMQRRMPIACEPIRYGAVTGPLSVDPGWTFVFNPYFFLEGIREGFGVTAQYTLVSHLRDFFRDCRPEEERRRLPAQLNQMRKLSSWGMEHVTIGALYDFGKRYETPEGLRPCYNPKISVYWDIPVSWLVAERAAKTTAISLMFELDF